ncbi:MAG: hypothetical protein EOT05_02300 [Candidatus Microsaccharimonas sossegonensis]|uniref:Uncharacterized protein n=1 Tax=Candidatus Microsaccharimonas sossegonensis TaxID=2506948 RepID=A0A4Q0AIS0_9BACT|nr:MAG: hypothetical protein EOT05_02300 [Candidatus Microsaccharimonas sossegonensis]
MKTFIYKKYSPRPNILHLYEHVVSIHIHEQLRKMGYYCYVDYAIKAQTHDQGLATITIEVYNSMLETEWSDLLLWNFEITDALIQIAYYQFLAEEGVLFTVKNANLKEELEVEHSNGWQTTKNIDTPKDISGKDDTALVASSKDIPLLSYDIVLNFQKKEVAKESYHDALLTLGHNIQVHLSNKKGYYRSEFSVIGNEIKLSFQVIELLSNTLGQSDSLIATGVIEELIESEALDVFIDAKKARQLNAISISTFVA